MRKRSLTIAGHPTSIALEPEFWEAVTEMAGHHELTIPGLIEGIDKSRQTANLSSAIRLAALQFYRQKALKAAQAE